MDIRKQKNTSFTQKNRTTNSGSNNICQSLGVKTTIGKRDDRLNVFHLCNVKNLSDVKVHEIIYQGKQNDYVYDIATESHDFE